MGWSMLRGETTYSFEAHLNDLTHLILHIIYISIGSIAIDVLNNIWTWSVYTRTYALLCCDMM